MKKRIASILTAAAMCFALAGCNSNSTSGGGNSTPTSTPANNSGNESTGDNSTATPPASGDTINLRVWAAEEDQNLTKELVEKFKQTYSDYTFDIQIGVQSEATAKDAILVDVSAAPDVFAFASDQLNALIAGNALATLDELDEAFKAVVGKSIDDIMNEHTDSSVAGVTKEGKKYAFPMGAGNNLFLFYDKTVLNEDQVGSWDDLLAAANAAGKKVGMTLASGWYNGGFFIGAGFTVSTDESGKTVMDWNGTSADGITGVQVVQAMINIASNNAFQAITDGQNPNEIASGKLCAIVDGSWDISACQAIWGETPVDADGDGETDLDEEGNEIFESNAGAVKLPTFTVDGKQVQQGCFSGFKFMGVNKMSPNAGWAAVLAEFLTNEESQAARFAARQLAPTNKKTAENEAVKADAYVSASVAQDMAASAIQDVSDKYWSPMETLGEQCAQGVLTIDDTEAIQAALDEAVAGATVAIG